MDKINVSFDSSVIKRWFFIDVFSLLRIYRRRNDPNLDLVKLKDEDTAKSAGQRLDRAWKEQVERCDKTPSLIRVMYNAFGTQYLFLGIWQLFWILFIHLGSYFLLKLLVNYKSGLAEPSDTFFEISLGAAHGVAVALFLSCFLASVCIHRLKSECTRIGIQVRASMMVLIYRKSLRLYSVTGETSDIVNLVGEDCNRIAEAFVNFHFLWSTGLAMIVVVLLAEIELGLAVLPVLGLLLLLVPLQCVLGKYLATLAKGRSRTTSERVHLMSEVLTAIKLVKFYAWEKHFLDRLTDTRRVEIAQLSKHLAAKSALMAAVFGAPVLATMISLQTFHAIYPDEILQADMVFALLSIFNTLRYPLLMLPLSIQTTKAALHSLKNLELFLKKPEVQPPAPTPDTKEGAVARDPALPSGALINMNGATFAWGVDARPVLSDLNLQIRRGQIFAIVGDVGAGKSSILSAIMGQMVCSGGDIAQAPGLRLAYCPSEPWILSVALRDNVVFGSKFDLDKYRRVVKACALHRDFKALTQGDRTEIGERGYNLTLGQRHRVSIARAVYNDADVVLMDDPLSPMDPRVGKHLFRECIQGLLKDKAVVFVTNQLHFLPHCDHIFVMKSGKCIEQGNYADLMASDVDLAALVGESIEIEDPNAIDDIHDDEALLLSDLSNSEAVPQPTPDPSAENPDNEPPRVSTEHGSQPSRLGPYGNMPSVTFSRTNTIEKSNGANPDLNEITISRMIERGAQGTNEEHISKILDRHQLSVLGGAGLAINTSTVQTENNALARAMERNQMTIHSLHYQDQFGDSDLDEEERVKQRRRLRRRLYLRYFQESPGIYVTMLVALSFMLVHAIRLYNDYWLQITIDQHVATPSHDVSSGLGMYSALAGAFVAAVFLRGIAFLAVICRKSSSFHFNMLAPVLRAPMSYFEYTPLSRVLHSFARHLNVVDEILSDSAFQALQFLPLVVGTFLMAVVVIPYLFVPGILLSVLAVYLLWYSKGVEDKLLQYEASSRPPMFSHLSATLEGLHSIRVYKVQARFDAYNLTKIDTTNKAIMALTLVKCWTSLYIDFLASLFIYATALLFLSLKADNVKLSHGVAGLALTNAMQLLMFGQWTAQAMLDFHSSIWSIDQLVHYRSSISPEGPPIIDDCRPPPNWPATGQIDFRHVSLRYHRYEVAVLKNVSFTIQGREKVAIVGRTGSGKTTLLTSLLRLVEVAEGSIEIDGLDIAQMGLEDLRRNIAVIPQEPVLFFGTIRSNLDPYSRRTDAEMWRALEAVHLSAKVRSLVHMLDAPIVENGTIFTFGQRQLFCIARAILLQCRILILDEATSAVDLHTDHLIQDAIATNFTQHTILFVGHRLHTIIEADKVLVMDKGHVVEFDSPERLLNNPVGHLYSLIRQNGESAVQNLLALAAGKAALREKRCSQMCGAHSSDTPCRSEKPNEEPISHLTTNQHTVDSSLQTHLTINSTLLPTPAEMPRSLEDMFTPSRPSQLDLSGTNSMSNTLTPPRPQANPPN
ncbi:Multidrug resistance-associated protein 5 [Entomophthora muscae]|uniref:Multidrug resistance-associated protein 5 n=1 Tax=Entomophthora muscae TaxID=34485 RepID=A0ACC2U8T1_9FUNG|nr:Multidrug resistance-associated protein 5 [Entomophthora muscae]